MQVGAPPPTHTEHLVIVHIGLDNSRLNHYLPDGNIELRDDTPQLIQLVLSLVSDNAISAIIHRDRTTLLFRALATYSCNGLEQGSNVSCFRIIDLNKLTAQRRKLSNLILCLQLLTLTRCYLIRRSNEQYVANLPLIQTTCLQHKIQSLVPRHILQPQGNVALNSITRHQIQISEVSNQLQHRSNINILKVKRKLLTGVSKALKLTLLDIIRRQRLNANCQLIIRLKDQVIVEALRLDTYINFVCLGRRTHILNRRRKILHIETNLETVWERSFRKGQLNFSALLLNIGRHRGVRQSNDDITFALLTTLKINTLDLTAGDRSRFSQWLRRGGNHPGG